jgi:DNA invertase Pin-like site-specific DNA recombinase
MIAAVYARKSTDQSDVAADAKSVTRQVEGHRTFITARGWTLDEAHVYTDDGVSGALFANRAEFQR